MLEGGVGGCVLREGLDWLYAGDGGGDEVVEGVGGEDGTHGAGVALGFLRRRVVLRRSRVISATSDARVRGLRSVSVAVAGGEE